MKIKTEKWESSNKKDIVQFFDSMMFYILFFIIFVTINSYFQVLEKGILIISVSLILIIGLIKLSTKKWLKENEEEK